MGKRWKRLPGSRSEPAGLERKILRRLPGITLYGTLGLGAPSLLVRLWFVLWPSEVASRVIQTTDIGAIALLSLFWTVIFTLALVCCIVFVMKGPAYIADAYELPDRDRPAPDR